jgi:hypothetical protein
MSGVAGRSGRKAFEPTQEQRRNVKLLAGFGIPQDKICLMVINPQTDKPLDPKSLRKQFSRELEIGAVELHARISNFIVATIFGITPPAGTVAIDNQHVRGSLAMFFAETRMGWKKTAVNREYVGGPPADMEDVRQRLRDKVDRIAKSLRNEPASAGGQRVWREEAPV